MSIITAYIKNPIPLSLYNYTYTCSRTRLTVLTCTNLMRTSAEIHDIDCMQKDCKS